jgi:bacterioferritin-associated ferredoxin
MYICICNAVTEKAIRDAVRDGARSVFDLSLRTGCSTQCGTCTDVVRDIMEATLAEIGAPRAPVKLKVVANS